MKFQNYFESLITPKKIKKDPNTTRQQQQQEQEFLSKLYFDQTLEKVLTQLKQLKGQNCQDLEPHPQHISNNDIDDIFEKANLAVEFNYNVCFYGFGDKEKKISQYFLDAYTGDKIIIEIKGYDPSFLPHNFLLRLLLSFDQINDQTQLGIDNVMQEVKQRQNISNEETFQKLLEIIQSFKDKKQELLFIFHNLDCFNFYSQDNLLYLSKLARQNNVTFITSIDSIQFPKMINKEIFNNFGFYYFEYNSFILYKNQLTYLNFFYAISQKNKNLNGTKGILKSLTKPQRALVFLVLKKIVFAKQKQLDENELFQEAMFEGQASNLHQFRENLKEAINHKLIDITRMNPEKIQYKTQFTKEEYQQVAQDFKSELESDSDDDDDSFD